MGQITIQKKTSKLATIKGSQQSHKQPDCQNFIEKLSKTLYMATRKSVTYLQIVNPVCAVRGVPDNQKQCKIHQTTSY